MYTLVGSHRIVEMTVHFNDGSEASKYEVTGAWYDAVMANLKDEKERASVCSVTGKWHHFDLSRVEKVDCRILAEVN
jgi:hypothetical protein